MPEQDYVWLPRENLLTFEEIGAIVDAFTPLGVDRVRLTGGEPLLRRDLPVLIESLATRPTIADLALTTNGVLLRGQAAALRAAGLHRITVSLDTLDSERFRELTRTDDLAKVLDGIDAAGAAGFHVASNSTRSSSVVNDEELVPLLEYAKAGVPSCVHRVHDVGGATDGPQLPSSPVARSSSASRHITAPCSRSTNNRRLRRIRSSWPTGLRSGSFRPPRSRSARPAIEAV